MDKWLMIERLLKKIYRKEIKNQKYFMFGYQEEYREIPVVNYGYVPFYDGLPTNRVVDIIPDIYKLNRPAIIKTSTEYITVHDTASGAPSATPLAHNKWLHSMANDPENKNSVSWHFTVGDKEIYQHLPTIEVAHHAGDGYREYGSTYFNEGYKKESITGGNLNSVGIESCVNYGSDYTMTMRNLAKLVAELLIEFDLPIHRVKQHNAFSGKDCPMTMRHANRWDEFLDLVDIELFGKLHLNDVKFSWKSLSPDIMDDTGKIINHPRKETIINYQVTVTYNNEVKVYPFSSKLLEFKE